MRQILCLVRMFRGGAVGSFHRKWMQVLDWDLGYIWLYDDYMMLNALHLFIYICLHCTCNYACYISDVIS